MGEALEDAGNLMLVVVAIAKAGCERAKRDGYHNDHQVRSIIERVEAIRAGRGGLV